MAEKALFMLGNGFDLAHRLPTTYFQFYYFLEALRIVTQNGLSSLQIVLDHAPKNHTSHLNIDYFQQTPFPEYMNTIISILNFGDYTNQNIWHSYFSTAVNDNSPLNTWIDLEKEIKTAIQTIEKNFLGRIDPVRYVMEEMHCSKDYNAFSENILSLEAYLQNRPPKPKEVEKQLEQEMAFFLSQELLKYAFCFELYLRFFVSNRYILPQKDNTLGPSPPLQYLFRPYFGERYILTFNYTDTVELLYPSYKTVHHIHGSIRSTELLQERMTDPAFQLHTPLVLGFHEKLSNNNPNNSPFIWFEKFFQRILHKTGTDVYNWINNLRKDDILKTFIYGHSLDSTDADLIELIFEKSKEITIYYHDEAKLPTLLMNLISIFDKQYVNENHNNGKITFKPTPTSQKTIL